jgi:hypothetical protein
MFSLSKSLINSQAGEIYTPDSEENYYACSEQYSIPPSTLDQTRVEYRDAYQSLNEKVKFGLIPIRGTITNIIFKRTESGSWVRPDDHDFVPNSKSDNICINGYLHSQRNWKAEGILKGDPITTSVIHTWCEPEPNIPGWLKTRNSIYLYTE